MKQPIAIFHVYPYEVTDTPPYDVPQWYTFTCYHMHDVTYHCDCSYDIMHESRHTWYVEWL